MKELVERILTQKGLHFIHAANVGTVDARHEVADGVYIRKAHPDEVGVLRDLIPLVRLHSPMMPDRNPYETSVRSTEAEPGKRAHSIADLPEAEWRYCVFEFQGNGLKVHELVDSSILTNTRLEIGPSFMTVGGMQGFGGGPDDLYRFFQQTRGSDEPFLHIDAAAAKEIRIVHQKVQAFHHGRLSLRDAIRRFAQLDWIPAHSPLRFLGYVSILESIVTHAPDTKDPYDSLTRQVRQKMILVGRRSIMRIPYDLFGSDVKPETLWTRLYEYRSAIAHGVTPDFDKRLSILKSREAAASFIRCATVALMRQALEEPDLIADLQNC